MFPMNGEVGAVFTVMVACLAVEAIMEYQVKQLNEIGFPAMAIDIEEVAEKNRKVRDCV